MVNEYYAKATDIGESSGEYDYWMKVSSSEGHKQSFAKAWEECKDQAREADESFSIGDIIELMQQNGYIITIIEPDHVVGY